MEQASRQLLRALRGRRSQLAFSRRLGHRSAVAAEWEAGRHFPTGDEVLRACRLVGIDVAEVLHAFHPGAAIAWSPGPDGLAAWLRALQGSTTQLELAARTGLSRHQVGRALSGATRPRLPQLLAIVDALTGRAAELVALLVDIDDVPALAPRFHAARRAATLAWDLPWAMAVLMQVHVGVPVDGAVPHVAAALGLDPERTRACLDALVDAGLACPGTDGRWRVLATPTVQTPDPATHRAWVRAWAEEAAARRDLPSSVVNVNLCSLGRADLERVKALQARAFQELRGIVAGSDPVDTVALVVWQVTELSAS